ncbi:phosphate acyltransferase PlsX [Xylocopilactobacillus apicola]|uniref:Phosphate acyltransferase n=1 Tax=Xylocopilactobacillus apicola TaxID=2932184 RepID=A0AAU9D714_9LACO|nr:phosphate acyltransferase PlsX [Xylocopilactobacillus apicola]BDR58166.1 phosphate acyltransferase [Xylocopilactobacillus apicola]
MKIAIDAMGGDDAPVAIVEGVKKFLSEDHETKIRLFGPSEALAKLIETSEQLEIINTTQVVEGNDEPVAAIRKKKDSSLVRAAQDVKDKQSDGFLSCGNTGAVLAAGIFVIGRIKNVERPALMPTLPTKVKGVYYNMLDVGANAESKAKYLVQFAQMGSIYAEDLRGVKNPVVKLLNIGSEEHKGDELHQTVHQELSQLPEINFQGNIEPNEIMAAKADVIVTDGFTGNAVLKTMEGTMKTVLHLLKDSLMTGNITTKLGALLVKNDLGNLASQFDNSRFGGAVLLGVNAPVIKGHGNSQAQTVYYAIKQVKEMISEQTVTKFRNLYQ